MRFLSASAAIDLSAFFAYISSFFNRQISIISRDIYCYFVFFSNSLLFFRPVLFVDSVLLLLMLFSFQMTIVLIDSFERWFDVLFNEKKKHQCQTQRIESSWTVLQAQFYSLSFDIPRTNTHRERHRQWEIYGRFFFKKLVCVLF